MGQLDRTKYLDEIFTQIKETCVKNDLRFGQLMEVIRTAIDADDLFYVENKKILKCLENYEI